MGFFDALKSVEQEAAAAEVPNHLRDASRDAKGFGHGEGYMYPHAYQDHWVAQQYLPNELQGKVFYHVGNLGYEKNIADQVNRRREIQLESVDVDAFPENLTFSPGDKGRDIWLRRTVGGRSFGGFEGPDVLEGLFRQIRQGFGTERRPWAVGLGGIQKNT